MKHRALTEADVKFEITCMPEDTPVRGNALDSGDPAEDRKIEDEIISDLDNGNEWAWCCVRVRATWKGFTGEDYLGGCCYGSRAEFEAGGYLPDMKAQALADLNASVARTAEEIGSLLVTLPFDPTAGQG